MTHTVVAIYDDIQEANMAVRDLVDNGFPRDNISIIANNSSGQYGYDRSTGGAQTFEATNETDTVSDETGAGAGVGAGIGAAIGGIGGLLIGLGALTIPGIGPVIAAGPLAVALATLTGAGVGAVAGGVTGGLLGALIGLGIPEEEAEYYAEGVRRGGILVTVQAEDNRSDEVLDILNRYKPINIDERVAQWRQQGWTGYSAPTQPVSTPSAHPVPNTGRVDESAADTIPVNREQSVFNTTSNQADFDPDNPDFRNHYTTYLVNSGYPYDYFIPAYQYGYGIARNPRYQNSSWEMVSPNVQREWEREHPGSWERYQSAIQYGWENANGQSTGQNYY